MLHSIKMFPNLRVYWSQHVSTSAALPDFNCDSNTFTHIVLAHPPQRMYDQRNYDAVKRPEQKDWYCWADWHFDRYDQAEKFKKELTKYNILPWSSTLRTDAETLAEEQYNYWRPQIMRSIKVASYYRHLAESDEEEINIMEDAQEQTLQVFAEGLYIPTNFITSLYNEAKVMDGEPFDTKYWERIFHSYIPALALEVHHFGTWEDVLFADDYDTYVETISNRDK